MTYEVRIYPDAQQQIGELPQHALHPFADVVAFLQLTPWSGGPINQQKPDAPVRTTAFGERGLVTYLVLEDQELVDVLTVVWAEP